MAVLGRVLRLAADAREGPFGWNPRRTKLAKQRQGHAAYPSVEQKPTNSIHYTPHAPLIWMLAPFT